MFICNWEVNTLDNRVIEMLKRIKRLVETEAPSELIIHEIKLAIQLLQERGTSI
jgi:hypothetical protein